MPTRAYTPQKVGYTTSRRAPGFDRAGTGYAVDMATSGKEDRLLGIYLNDHLAGAVAGSELAHRLADAEPGIPALAVLAAEISEDKQALLDMMAKLEIPVRQYKKWAAWTIEKAARLKFNGHLTTRSPLSRVIELEAMRLGVEGKAAGWRTLRARAETDHRLDTVRLDELIKRAGRQVEQLEDLRVRAAADTFGGQPVR
jgi:hypothetical protein